MGSVESLLRHEEQQTIDLDNNSHLLAFPFPTHVTSVEFHFVGTLSSYQGPKRPTVSIVESM